MSHKNNKEKEKNSKELFSLLGNKTIKNFSTAHQKCPNCKKKKYLVQCIKCFKRCCFDCIKELYYNEYFNFVENKYLCIDCKKSNAESKNENTEGINCFLCGSKIKEKKKHNYLINEKQKLDLKNISYSGNLSLDEKEENFDKDEFSLISICNKCYLNNSEMIDSLLKKNSEKSQLVNEIGNNKANVLNMLNMQNLKIEEIKKEKEQKIENIEIKNKGFDGLKNNNINDNNINKENINKNYLQKLLEINSFLKGIYNTDSKDVFPNKIINKSISQDYKNINNFMNLNGQNKSYQKKEIQNNFLQDSKNKAKIFPNFINNDNNLNSNLLNFSQNKDISLLNTLNKCIDNKKEKEKKDINLNEKEQNKKEKENQNNSDNIYFCLYRTKDVLSQMAKYLNKFENNNVENNISILANIDILTSIFSMIIGKIKSDNKKNIFLKDKGSKNKEKENDKNEKENKNEAFECLEKENNYEYYLNYILTITESFKNKLKAIKLYNNFKNLFLIVLFKNIEKLILKTSELIGDNTQNTANEQSSNSKANMSLFTNNNPNPLSLNMDFLNSNNLLNKSNFFQPLSPLFSFPKYQFNATPNYSQMFQNKNMNMNMNMLNIPEPEFNLKSIGNFSNIMNSNSYNINNQQTNLNVNAMNLGNIEQKKFDDKNNQS